MAEKGETPVPGSCEPGAAFLDMTEIFLEPQGTVSPDRHMLLRVSDRGFRQLSRAAVEGRTVWSSPGGGLQGREDPRETKARTCVPAQRLPCALGGTDAPLSPHCFSSK